MSCEDQGLVPTKHCMEWKCQQGFDNEGDPIYPELEKRGRFWCCPTCGGSYGANPHPDLK